MKKCILYIIMSAVSLNVTAQNSNVGIGTSTPDASAILELQATDKGILIPRTDTNLVLSPATGLLIYESADNTFYYFDGTYWVAMGAGGAPPPGGGWQLTGDAGTTAGTNFIGTTDAVDFVTKTAGSAATNERLRVTSGGKVVVNNTTSTGADIFSVYGTGSTGAINALGTFAINGYSTAGGTGVYGENTGAGNGVYGANNAGGTGVFGSNSLNGQGIWGRNTGSNGIGVYGTATSTSSNAGSFYASDASNTFSSLYTQHDGSGDAVTAIANGTGYGGYFEVISSTNTNDAILAVHNNPNGNVINAVNAAASGTGTGYAVRGIITQSNASGVVGGNFHTTGTGVFGYGNNGSPLAIPAGSGGAFAGAHGVGAFSTTATGTGVIGVGNNLGGFLTFTDMGGGSGGAFTGTWAGAVGFATDGTDGNGVVGAGNGLTAVGLFGGAGVIGYGTTTGVAGFSDNTSGFSMGGYFGNANANYPFAYIAAIVPDVGFDGFDDYVGAYFDDGLSGGLCYIGAEVDATPYKIVGAGAVSTIIKDEKDVSRVMYAPEAPEILFEDYGMGSLVKGKAHIDLDPIFVKNSVVNEKHPLRVFIQLEGDCNGVYVSGKSANGFDVTELAKGASNTNFSWHVIANRADEFNDKGELTAKYADNRFELAPKRLPRKTPSSLAKVEPTKLIKLEDVPKELPKKEKNVVPESKPNSKSGQVSPSDNDAPKRGVSKESPVIKTK